MNVYQFDLWNKEIFIIILAARSEEEACLVLIDGTKDDGCAGETAEQILRFGSLAQLFGLSFSESEPCIISYHRFPGLT